MNALQNLKTKTKVVSGSLIPILFLLVLGGVALFNVNSLVENNKWVDHTYKVLGKASGVTAAAVDMETGMRGYLLAGKDEFLSPYTNGAKAAEGRIDDLRKTVSDNPKQVARLDDIAKTLGQWRSDVVDPMIALRLKRVISIWTAPLLMWRSTRPPYGTWMPVSRGRPPHHLKRRGALN
jgi:methyl-accepting chemotaxis protein